MNIEVVDWLSGGIENHYRAMLLADRARIFFN
jgi:hypothetical protein